MHQMAFSAVTRRLGQVLRVVRCCRLSFPTRLSGGVSVIDAARTTSMPLMPRAGMHRRQFGSCEHVVGDEVGKGNSASVYSLRSPCFSVQNRRPNDPRPADSSGH